MQDGCFASVMLKPNIALLLSLAAEGIYHMADSGLLHSRSVHDWLLGSETGPNPITESWLYQSFLSVLVHIDNNK